MRADKRERCMDLSVETISLMLSLANVCAGGRYLVIDETGLFIAAILERGASVFVLHENKQPFLDTLKFFPHLQQHFRVDLNSTDSSTTIHSLDFLEAFHSSTVVLTPPQPGPLYERKLRTYNRELQAHKIWKEAGFDGFITASSYDPQSYLARCIQRIEICSNIVIYSPYREPIADLQYFALSKMPTRPILAPMIHEIRAPRWSALKGRARPDMISRGGGGWIFSGVKVEESEIEEKYEVGRKKRKVSDDGTRIDYLKSNNAAETP